MAKNEAKIRFTAETGEFNNQIKQSNSEMSKLRAEMKLNDEQMKTAGKSVEGLQQKQKLLESQLSASQQKTEALSQKVEKAKEIYGENSAEVMKLQTQLLTAQTAEEKLQRQVASCNDELEAQRDAANRVETATEQLSGRIQNQQKDVDKLKSEYIEAVLKFGETSDEAKELAQQIDIASGQLKENKKAMKDATSAADDLDKSLDNASDNDGEGFTVFKGALSDLISEGIQFAIGKVNELVDYMFGLPEATREIRQDFATLTTAFDNMGYSNEVAQETWKGLYGVFGEDDRAVETANNIARIAQNEEDLNKWVTITTGIWGTYQDSLPVEGLAEAADETAKVGTVTGGLADALNWSSEASKMFAQYMGGDVVTAEDAFNVALSKCNTEQERQRLITDTLTALYGDAAVTYRDTSGAMLDAKEATAENILAENNLATAIEPVTTAYQNLKNEMLTALLPAMQSVSQVATDALNWMREHPTATKAIAAAVGVLAIGITGLAVAWGVYTVAQWAANSALLASPITWIVLAIVAAIAALVAIIVVVVSKWDEIKEALGNFAEWCNEKIIEPLKNLGTTIKTKFTEIVNNVKQWGSDIVARGKEAISNFINSVVTFFKELPGKVWTWLSNTIAKVGEWASEMAAKAKNTASNFVNSVVTFIKELPGKIWTWLKNTVSKVVSWGSEMLAKGKAAATNMVNAIVNTIKSMPSKVANVGRNLVEGIWNGISGSLSWIKSKITGWVGNVTSFLKNLFGIQSPSTVMRDEVGRYLAEGVAVGIEENTKTATEAMEKLGKEVIKTAKANIEEVRKQEAEQNKDAKKKSTKKQKTAKQLEEELNAEILKVAKERFKEYKQYNELTVEAEMEYWDDIRKQFKTGTKQRIEADKEYLNARNKIDEELLSASEKRLNRYKTYNEMTIAEEAGYWDEVRKLCTEGTDARLEADKKYLAAKKEFDNQILKAEEDLQNALDQINDKIIGRQKELVDTFDLFSTFDPANTRFGTSTDLIMDLRADIDVLEKYAETIDTLESKIGGTALFDYLKGLGIDGMQNVMYVLKMTDEELKQYSQLFDKRNEVAGKLAKDELAEEVAKERKQSYQTYHEAIDAAGGALEMQNNMSAFLDKDFISSTDIANAAYKEFTNNVTGFNSRIQESLKQVEITSSKVVKTISNGIKSSIADIVEFSSMLSGSISDKAVEMLGLSKSNQAAETELRSFEFSAAKHASDVNLYLNGQKFATATAADTDTVNGTRMQLMQRGLAR